ncbi:probable inactive leucine-rich repeat receptor-like protein kinase At3g03770 [Actinidia eriantha]|uniref:probable inactive leucine-rich repeat receptor-like protein kinase At3g03770 n=1 Tax=Actinidia eriantha TaxID=165200 RepID=UPI00258F034A|nr:probable inactive leucine-rich repeat receptor-like protein kinase At3g03770 [Actinidia eriantha]
MAKPVLYFFFFFMILLMHSIHESKQQRLQSTTNSQSQALLRIQHQLNYPQVLSIWNQTTDFCNLTDPNPSLTLVCYEDKITQLHINGDNPSPNPSPILLPHIHNFSSDVFFSNLATFSSLKVLSLVCLGLWGPLPASIGGLSSLEILNLTSNYFSGTIPQEISALTNLQTLILDHNSFTAQVPACLASLPLLSVLSLNNNSLTGSLPHSFSSMDTLRILSLSMNQLSGQVPSLKSLSYLQILDLGYNEFGPHFPSLPNKLVIIVLRNNRFRFGIPEQLSIGSFSQLQKLDISSNGFVGPFLFPLLSLPSLSYLDISGNKLTGMLSENTSCSSDARLAYVNLSWNRLTGDLPACLQSIINSTSTGARLVQYAGNCLSQQMRGEGGQEQRPLSFCHNEALAVTIMPQKRKRKPYRRPILLASSLVGGGAAFCGLLFLGITRVYYAKAKQTVKTHQPKLILEKISPAAYTMKLLSDARYISETMKLGALGLPPYRTFALEELKEATSNFSTLNLIEGSHSKVYKGTLTDGTLVAIRNLKMRRRHGIQSYRHQIELISKLRHRHLVSAVGHCFECYPDDSSISTIFLVFEFVPNGTLRSCISGKGLSEKKFSWTQRIAAAIGIAKGIQFLHTGIMPGVFSNNLKITDVLLDQDLHAKISNYNLPLLAENRSLIGAGVFTTEPSEHNRAKMHEDKKDVYDMGVILLEIIVGRAIMSQSAIRVAKDLLQVSLKTDDVARRSIVDPAIHKECSDESVKTVMEICVRCLSNEPTTDGASVEDVLWNLQFAAQVQDLSSSSTSTATQGLMPIVSLK